MKHVLIITYYWPPAGGPGVQRWLKFVKYLPDFKIQPVLYIPENPNYPIIDETLLREVPENLTLVCAPGRVVDFFFNWNGGACIEASIHQLPLVVCLLSDPSTKRERTYPSRQGTTARRFVVTTCSTSNYVFSIIISKRHQGFECRHGMTLSLG